MNWSCGKSLAMTIVALGLAAGLSGCGPETAKPVAAAVPAAPAIDPDLFVGKWGLASYHKEEDRARTETAARAQCNKPYVIAKGPTGGLMMHVADTAEPQELFIKSADGKNYIGPQGPPGVAEDREIVSFDKGVLVTAWMDPDTANRYGTMVYTRCKTK